MNGVRRWLLKVWESHGGGFYGFVALLTFLYIEALDIAGDLAAAAGASIDIGFIISFVLGNIVDAFVNGLKAAIWPVSWIGTFGIGLVSAGLLAGSYVAYLLVRPTVLRLLTPSDGPVPALAGRAGQRDLPGR